MRPDPTVNLADPASVARAAAAPGRTTLRTLRVPHAPLVTVKQGEFCRDPEGLLWRVERRQDTAEGFAILSVASAAEHDLPVGQGAQRLPGPVEVVAA